MKGTKEVWDHFEPPPLNREDSLGQSEPAPEPPKRPAWSGGSYADPWPRVSCGL